MGKRTKKGASQVEEKPPLDFLEWCAAFKISHPKCTIGQLPGTGRGVVATANIAAGEVVVEVPDEVVLLVENSCIAQELEDAGLAKGVADDSLLEIQGLVLAVMAEKAAGGRSDWASYLSWIPDDLSHMPMHWTDEELQELRGTAAADKLDGHVQTPSDVPTQVRMLWEEVAEPFIKEHPHLNLPSGAEGWARYQWATAAVASYSFVLGDDHYQAMVPFWDALNHITGKPNVRLHHEQHAKSHKGCLQMIATCDIAAGEEVVNNYGELSQAELLRAYGYVEEHDTAHLYSHVQVPLRFVLQAIALSRLTGRVPAAQAGAKPTGAAVSKAKPAGEEGQGSCKRQEHHHHHHQDGCCPDGDCHGDFDESESGDDSDGGSDWDLAIDDELDDLTSGSPYGDAPRDDQQHTGSDSKKQKGKQRGKEGGPAAQRVQLGLVGMGRRQCREAVAGLPGRLRYLRRVGLLPPANVFKLFMPDNYTPKSNLSQLLELIRLLLLPLSELEAHRQSVMDWRPAVTTPDTLDTGGVLVESGPATQELAEQASQVMQDTLRYMLSRYTCSLDEDVALMAKQQPSTSQSPAADAAVGSKRKGSAAQAVAADRLRRAVVARAAEKRCLHAWLDAWWSGTDDQTRGAMYDRCKAAMTECWSKPRPGMHGVKAVGSESGSDSCDDEGEEDDEGEDGTSDEACCSDEACPATKNGHCHNGHQHPKKEANKASSASEAHFAFGFTV